MVAPNRQTTEMILPTRILEQLDARWDDFSSFDLTSQGESVEYGRALEELAGMTPVEILELIGTEETPGAIPTTEFNGMTIPFDKRWQNHAEAREWAAGVLKGNPTLAVDGSQIPPPPGAMIPVAAVQAAWFENLHTSDGSYQKQLEFELLTPSDLRVEEGEERFYSEQKINLRRFELEMKTLCRRIEVLADERRPDSLPLAFIDSSLVISFADRLQGDIRSRHIAAVLELLRCSERTGIPVVGYVDGSRARDLTHLLHLAFRLPSAEWIDDAMVLASRLQWGDRTPIMICARGSADKSQSGILESLAEFRREIGFVYLGSSAAARPARLEIPLWVWRSGRLERVVDLVRAEVVVGNGYPYAIAAADAAAAMRGADREQFYAIFHRFAADRGLRSPISPKVTSKGRRR